MWVRLGFVAVAAWASLASASKTVVAPVVMAPVAPPPAPPPLVELCTMDEDCPQGEHCCEQIGSPVCCKAQ